MTDLSALELGQSYPVETTMKVPDIREAWMMWAEMIDGASRTLDIEQFYMASEPGHRMEPVLEAIERAGERGVAVRVMVDRTFYERIDEDTGERIYAAVPDRLQAMKGVTLRTMPIGQSTGGVQHAKFFIVDGADAWIGSQNFDWRSLEHITELGVRMRAPSLVDPLLAVFESDWEVSQEGHEIGRPEAVPGSPEFTALEYGGAPHRALTVASPEGWVPDPERFDLPRIVERIDQAETSVSVQLLSFDTRGHGEGMDYWDVLDRALRAAAARKVRVRLMVGDWARNSERKLAVLTSLAACPSLDVRMVTVPQPEAGPIPFARVIHTKTMVVDGQHTWIGTNNWSPDYFLSSRNVGLVVEGEVFARDLQRAFDHVWSGEYAYDVGSSSLSDVLSTVRRVSHAGELPIVIFDLDSTLLDPGPRNLRILHEFSADYGARWPWLATVTASVAAKDIGYNLAETFEAVLVAHGHDPEPVVVALRAYWQERFFTNRFVAYDLPNPGAVSFARSCHSAGAVVYYMTGRHRAWVPGVDREAEPPFPEGMELGTLEVLSKRGFPVSDGRALLHLKPRFDIPDADFKVAAFPVLNSLGGVVVATFENEPTNANQFLLEYPEATHFWLLTEHSPHSQPPDRRLVPIDDFHVRPLPPC